MVRLESVWGLVRCEEKLKLRRKLRLTAPDPQTPAKNLSLSSFQPGEKITTPSNEIVLW